MNATWKAEFIVDSSGVWCDSKYRFVLQTDALQFAWGTAQATSARRWRVIETNDPEWPSSTPTSITGSLQITQARQTLSATGTVPFSINGALHITQVNQALVAAGNVALANVNGTLNIPQTSQTLSGSGVILVNGLTVTDNFNRANGTLGTNWVDSPSFTGLAIVSNAANSSTAAWRAAYWISNVNKFVPNHSAQIKWVSGSFGGPMVRHQSGTSSGYLLIVSGTPAATIYRIDSGGFTSIGSGGAIPALVNGDILKLSISGQTLTGSINGVVKASATDSTYLTGQPGLALNAATADDWSAGLTGSSGLVLHNTARILPPTGTLKIERTQPWSCVACYTNLFQDTANGYVLFTNVLNAPFTGYEIWIAPPNGYVRVKIMNSNDANIMIHKTGTTSVQDGKTHTIAATYDGSSTAAGVKIYVDGALETTTTEWDTLNATIVTGAGDMWIGDQSPGGQFNLEGLINFFAFSNIVRSGAYMAAHGLYETRPSVDANTTLYYNFSEGTGTTLTDQSSNGYNGTITGTGYSWY